VPSPAPAASPHGPTDWVPPQGLLNVLVIVLDDVGTDQLRIYAQDPGPAYACAPIQVATTPTPTLDVLRATGVLYSRAYVNPLCSPTRAAMLTGRHGFRTGVGSAIDRGSTAYTLPSGELFVSELIRDHNSRHYARGAFGKWHVAQVVGEDQHAADNGFERFEGTKGNLDDHYTWRKIIASGGGPAGGAVLSSTTVSPGADAPSSATYSASVTARDAAAWINAQSGPFFAWVGFNPPHAPFQVPPYERLSSKTRSKLAALGYEPGDRALATRADQSLVYQAQIEALDREIGELLAAIWHRLPNTMIVVVGDNGTPSETVVDAALAGRVKRSVYEYGARVPLLVTGPLAWFNAGRTCRNLVSAVDLFRTLANFTGITNHRIDTALAAAPAPNDSRSFLRSVLVPSASGPRAVAYSELFANAPPPVPPNVTWLRTTTDGQWRYVRRRLPATTAEELYDLTADPCNLTNLNAVPANLTPAQAAALLALRTAMDAI
jgi:arylsulfatase A-like enzyme